MCSCGNPRWRSGGSALRIAPARLAQRSEKSGGERGDNESATPFARDGASGDELPVEIVGAVNFVLRSRQIPGAVVGLVAGDGRLRAKAFGWRDAAARVPMTRETLFPIGSITRSITVFAIAALVDRGVLSWDVTLGDTFASEGAVPEEAKAITLRHLATHSSGLPPQPVGWEVDPAGSEPVPYQTSDLFDALRCPAGRRAGTVLRAGLSRRH